VNVVHFVQRYPPALGGSEAYFQRLSRYLSDKGHFVSVWTTTALDLEAFWRRSARCLQEVVFARPDVHVRHFGLWRWPLRRYMLKALSMFPNRTWQALTMPCNPIAMEMWREAGRYDGPCDIVHATAFPYAWPIVCARRLARKRNVPFMLTPFLHLGAPDDANDATRRQYLAAPLCALLQSADGVFVQTPSERDAVLGLGIPEHRVILQGLGVEPKECCGGDRIQARQRFLLPPKGLVVGHLANLSREKGTIDLLKACARLWEKGYEFHLLLAGPQMKNFRRFFAGFRRAERVRVPGLLSDEERRDFFAGIVLFALPSRSDSFGLVLLEAWANGLPNVAYRAGGPADLIRHGQDGLLARCGDIEELGNHLGELLANSQLRRELGAAGFERIDKEFRWGDKLAVVEQSYESTIRRAQERVRAGRAPSKKC
jgi:glycosyltransferase involved in cell wall biosynthesis